MAMIDGAGEKRIVTHDEAVKKADWLESIDPVPGRSISSVLALIHS